MQTIAMADKAEECYSVASGVKNSSIVLLCKDKQKASGKWQFQLSLRNAITLKPVSLRSVSFGSAAHIRKDTTSFDT